jgi:hypothetical protein
MKSEGSRLGMKWPNIIKEEGSRELQVIKICLEVIWRLAIIQVPAIQTAAQIMILRMNHMCNFLGLVLMAKVWRVLVAVAAGDEETEEEVEEEGGGDDDDEGEEETYVVSDTPESRLEGED